MKYIYRTLWIFFLPIYVVLMAIGFVIWSFLFIIYQSLYFIRKGVVDKDVDPDKTYVKYANRIYEKLLPK